jgi:hypothetical protein
MPIHIIAEGALHTENMAEFVRERIVEMKSVCGVNR